MTLAYGALTAAQRNEYHKALGRNALVHTQVKMLNLSHGLVATISDMWNDGQVNVSNSDGVSKVLSCGFRDPGHQLRLDAASPAAGVNSIDRLLQVTQMLYVRGLSQWVGVDVVTARPTITKRDGENVTVEAQSKESLHLRNVPSYTVPARTNVVAAIKRILTNSGETRFKFPANHTSKLPKDVHIGGADEKRQPWLVARRLAKSIGMQLTYDGSGFALLRVIPSGASWWLVDDETPNGIITPNLQGPPVLGADLGAVRNRVVVTYHTAATKKKKSQSLSVAVAAGAAHPFSAQSLASNGKLWWSTEFYDTPNIHSRADALKYARARLTEHLEQAITIEASVIPVWHLNVRDLLTVITHDATFNVRFDEGSIPLGPSDAFMTVGFQKYIRKPTSGLIRSR